MGNTAAKFSIGAGFESQSGNWLSLIRFILTLRWFTESVLKIYKTTAYPRVCMGLERSSDIKG